MATYEFNPTAYDEIENEFDRDRYIGKHDFMVKSAVEAAWPSGDTRFDIDGTLIDVGNKSFKFSLNIPESPESISAEGNTGKQRAMILNVKSWKALAKMGKKSPLDLVEGDTMQVDIYREKPKPGQDFGYLRLSHIVGPAKGTAEADKSMPGF